MSLALCNYKNGIARAVKHFWQTRADARVRNESGTKANHGTRGEVTSGRHMDGFADFCTELVAANGLPKKAVHAGGRLPTIPGYFRPTKNWDLTVVHDGRLVAALEFKSMVGSIGNNFNNRVEEVIGLGVDLATAYREGAFGTGAPQPFVGYLFLLRDEEKARSIRQFSPLTFPVREEFHNTSYIQRYDLLCDKLVREKIYTAAAAIVSTDMDLTGAFTDAGPAAGMKKFVTTLASHVAAAAAQ